jgi:hypothetical protein
VLLLSGKCVGVGAAGQPPERIPQSRVFEQNRLTSTSMDPAEDASCTFLKTLTIIIGVLDPLGSALATILSIVLIANRDWVLVSITGVTLLVSGVPGMVICSSLLHAARTGTPCPVKLPWFVLAVFGIIVQIFSVRIFWWGVSIANGGSKNQELYIGGGESQGP